MHPFSVCNEMSFNVKADKEQRGKVTELFELHI